MPYDTGARVRLTRDVQVTAAGGAFPGPLFLGGGLAGVVTGVAQDNGGGRNYLAEFDEQVRGAHLSGFATGLLDDLRQQVARAGGAGTGGAARTRYKVRFENGFVLDGLEEEALTVA